jgi:putative Ca2+/H+ antiporter (TMEM165/GDT1 family)
MSVTPMSTGEPVATVVAVPDDPPRLLYEGLIAALIGYAVLAVVVASWSQWQGHSPFYIAGLLGADLFFGTTPAPGTAVNPAHVIAYNGAHLLVFGVIGFVMAGLAALTERMPQGWYVFGIGFLFATFHIAVFPVWFGPAVREQLPVVVIALATAVAFLAMALWLLRQHPALRRGASLPD